MLDFVLNFMFIFQFATEFNSLNSKIDARSNLGYSALIIQVTPNGSLNIPYNSDHSVLPKGIVASHPASTALLKKSTARFFAASSD